MTTEDLQLVLNKIQKRIDDCAFNEKATTDLKKKVQWSRMKKLYKIMQRKMFNYI